MTTFDQSQLPHFFYLFIYYYLFVFWYPSLIFQISHFQIQLFKIRSLNNSSKFRFPISKIPILTFIYLIIIIIILFIHLLLFLKFHV